MPQDDLSAGARSHELSQLAQIQVCLCWPGMPKPTAAVLGLDGVAARPYQLTPPGLPPLPRPRRAVRLLPAAAELIAVDVEGPPAFQDRYGYFLFLPDLEFEVVPAEGDESLQRFEVPLPADALRRLSSHLGLPHQWTG